MWEKKKTFIQKKNITFIDPYSLHGVMKVYWLINSSNLLYFLKKRILIVIKNKLTCTLWAHCDLKNPLIIHRLVCRFFYSPLQGHVNFVILRTEQRPAWTQVQPPFVIKHMIQCIVYAIYLYCSFNYPVLPAFEVWSISSYLMPGEACTCAPGAWILLFHFHLPSFSPVVLIQPCNTE